MEEFEPVLEDRDTALMRALSELGATLARRSGDQGGDESDWMETMIALTASYPDPYVRCQIATHGSLRQLRALAQDENLSVRAQCAENGFIIDLDLQLMLAMDPEPVVIHAMLDRVDPYREVVEVLVDSPHRSVRARLATLNISTELLQRLAGDTDEKVSGIARTRLEQRASMKKSGARE